jgi:putative DNA primase/helicase
LSDVPRLARTDRPHRRPAGMGAAMSAAPFSLGDPKFDALRPLLLGKLRDGDAVRANAFAAAIAQEAGEHGIEVDAATVLRAGRDAVETVAAAEPLIATADFDAEVARLAKLPPVEYERQRKEAAERLQVRAAVLDRVVGKARGSGKTGQGSALLFDEVEPAAVPVPLAGLIAELSAVYAAHVILPAHAADAAALWTVATWATDHTHCAPILLLRSPEPRCGKSTLLALLDMTARRPLPAASITPAALFRTIEAASPTLLIDEGDAFLAGNEELRGVINAGHTRATAFVLRTVGDDHEPRKFSVFGFKAIALIGKAAHTITDRSVVIPLRRKLPSEKVTKLRDAPKGQIQALRAGLARWAQDDAHRIASAQPALPESLNDRAGDSWGPLLAVADLAGREWGERARRAAVALSGQAEEATSTRAELLADVRRVFDDKAVDRISGADLLAALVADEERPWATYNKGKAMSQSQLARRLTAFGISSRSVRLPDGKTPKGYPIEAFADAFARYLPATPYESATAPQASNDAGCGGLANRHKESLWHFEKPPQASNGADCGDVALSNPPGSDDDASVTL